MASRRMFSNRIIDSAKFLKMPSTSRLLYFDLGMKADDDGVVEAYNVIVATGASEDDLKILVAKGFVKVLNDDLVTYIIGWRENNKLRADRKIDSIYKNLLLQLIPEVELLEAKERADRSKDADNMGRPMDNQMASLGPHSLGQSSIVIDRYNNYIKRSFDFENFAYSDVEKLKNILSQCELLVSDEYSEILEEKQLNRFNFLRDIVTDIYFSNNRNLLLRLNYPYLCNIEEKCRNYQNISDYFNYYKAALINSLIKGVV